jgi:two-component system NarL family response regulator
LNIRVLIADDHPLVRDGLRFSIERNCRDIRIVAEAADGREVLQLAESQAVDVFVLDLTMPRLNGLDTAHELIRRQAKARIALLSIHESRSLVEQALRTGVRGYLTKETASRTIIEAIRELHAGRRYLSPEIAHYAGQSRPLEHRKRPRGMENLTAQERRVLQMIAEGWTVRQIAAELGRTLSTIQSHRKNLMSKLDLHKQTDLLRFAVKEGIAKL